MLFVIRMLRIGWRVLAQRDWASFPNEWAILRPSANGIIWRHLLEKKARVGLRFDARLALPSPANISFGACCQSRPVSFSEYCLAAHATGSMTRLLALCVWRVGAQSHGGL